MDKSRDVPNEITTDYDLLLQLLWNLLMNAIQYSRCGTIVDVKVECEYDFEKQIIVFNFSSKSEHDVPKDFFNGSFSKSKRLNWTK